MEFFGGIIFAIVVGFIAYKAYQARERRKARRAYIPPSGARDYRAPNRNGEPK